MQSSHGNFLVRVLVNDPQATDQCQLARELLKTNKAVWVCCIVLVETVSALRVYIELI